MAAGIQKFFFEKKNQKTFAPLRAALKHPGTKTIKVFFFFLFTKSMPSGLTRGKFFFLLPSAYDL
jgi:hypothetical protein